MNAFWYFFRPECRSSWRGFVCGSVLLLLMIGGVVLVCAGAQATPTAGANEQAKQDAADGQSIPLETHYGSYYWNAATSLGTLKLLIDTGTQQTTIFQSSLPAASKAWHKRTTKLVGIGNSTHSVSRFTAPLQFYFSSLPTYTATAVVAARNDYGDPSVAYDGILGLDFFDAYCVQMNMPSSSMEIFPKGACESTGASWISLPTKWTKSGILIRIKVKFPNSNVVSTYASVDTGSNGPLLLSGRFRAAARLPGKPTGGAEVKISGVNGTVDADMVPGCKILLGNGPGVLTGNIVMVRGQLHRHAFIFTPASGVPDANLGTAFLRLLDLRFDALHKVVFLQPRAGV